MRVSVLIVGASGLKWGPVEDRMALATNAGRSEARERKPKPTTPTPSNKEGEPGCFSAHTLRNSTTKDD